MENIDIRLKELSLRNYRGFVEETISFQEDYTVFIGENGSGKSAVIDAIAEFLKYTINDVILNENYVNISLNEDDIKNNTPNLELKGKFEVGYPENLTTFYPDELEEHNSNLKEIVDKYKDDFENQDDDLKTAFSELSEFDFEQENSIKIFKKIITEFQKEEYDLPDGFISSISEIDKWLIDNENNDKRADFTIKMELSKESDKPAISIEANIDELERFKHELKKQEKFHPPVFLDFGSGAINLDIIEYQSQNKQLKEKHLIYKDAFTTERFSIKEFIAWYDTMYKIKLQKPDNEFINKAIEYVNKAVCNILNDNIEKPVYSDLHMDYHLSGADLAIWKKNDKEKLSVNVKQLSSGEKSLIALIGDLARRTILANPIVPKPEDDQDKNFNEIFYTNPLEEAQGIVLIDEIDLHLHPRWQRKVIPQLRKTFPHVQFVVTTHSPLVLENVGKQNIRLLKDNTVIIPDFYPKGREVGEILEELMSENALAIQNEIDKYFELIAENKFEEADKYKKNTLLKLTSEENPIFYQADAMIKRKKM